MSSGTGSVAEEQQHVQQHEASSIIAMYADQLRTLQSSNLPVIVRTIHLQSTCSSALLCVHSSVAGRMQYTTALRVWGSITEHCTIVIYLSLYVFLYVYYSTCTCSSRPLTLVCLSIVNSMYDSIMILTNLPHHPTISTPLLCNSCIDSATKEREYKQSYEWLSTDNLKGKQSCVVHTAATECACSDHYLLYRCLCKCATNVQHAISDISR